MIHLYNILGKLQSLQKHKTGTETVLEDITSAWSTGIPTSVRFLGKSFHAVPKGPGGIILHDSPKSTSPQAKLKAPIADFAHTTNMLTMLSKAEIKMKSQAALKSGISSFILCIAMNNLNCFVTSLHVKYIYLSIFN